MEILNIIKESLHYPVDDYKNWLMIAVLFLLSTIFASYLIPRNDAVSYIGIILSILVGFVIAGISVSVMRTTFNHSDNVPQIDLQNNFIDGVKYVILSIIYYIIPAIVATILALGSITQLQVNANKIIDIVTQPAFASASPEQVAQLIPKDLLISFASDILIIAVVFIVLFIIAEIFLTMAIPHFVKNESLASGLDIKAVFSKITSIGWGNYIIFLIALTIVATIIEIIATIIGVIPYVGILISGFVLNSFLSLFMARAIALVYMQGA